MSSELDFMKGLLIFGDLGNDSLEDRVKYKERIVFATMKHMIPGWEKPRDWDSLTDEVKMERLTKLETV